jgi:ribose-phosphate pyrophosphokinase
VSELHAFDDSFALARRLARALGSAPPAPVLVHRFPDGESLVRVGPAPRRAILVRSLDRPDEKLVELLLAADALRRQGARQLTLVAPYLPYMRQDRVFHAGEPISQRVVGTLLGGAFDRVLTVEAHLHRIQRLSEVIPGSARSLAAAPALADWLARSRSRPCLVGPDAESAAWVSTLAKTSGLPWIVGRKRRLGDRRVRVELPPLPGASRRALLVDDIASSGATLAAAARALHRAGATRVDAVVVHAIFAPGALRRLASAGIARLVSTDSVAHESNEIGVAPLLAAAIRRRAVGE